MFQKYESCGSPVEQVVTISNPLYKSLKGIYFVGQTPFLVTSDCSNAWAALVNPVDSKVNLFVNVITFSNFSSDPITAAIWLNSTPPGKAATSTLVSASNIAIKPNSTPKALIQYVKSTDDNPKGGVNVFDRIVSGNSTLVSEEDGKFIIPPGGNFLVFLTSDSYDKAYARIALGWWEQRR